MFKALLSKQFAQLRVMYFQSRKKGAAPTGKISPGMIVLFAFLGICLFGGFAAMAFLFAMTYITETGGEYTWLYYVMMGFIALLSGLIGSVFTTYSALYKAKDNDLLLAMPIPPRMILFVRMISIFATSLIYVGLAFIPACIVAWFTVPVTVAGVICPLLGYLFLSLLTMGLSCILGFFVALISRVVKSKLAISLLSAALFIGMYYILYFRMNDIITSLAQNGEAIAAALERIYLIACFGFGTAGDIGALLIFIGVVAVFAALIYWIVSASFIRIVTHNAGGAQKGMRGQKVQVSSVDSALLKKEWKRFTGSVTYLLNCGIGVVILIALTVLAAVKSADLNNLFAELGDAADVAGKILAWPLVMAECFILGMNTPSTPSVSLEGNKIWIIRTLPVEAGRVLAAKERLHLLVNGIPGVLCALALGIFYRQDALTVLMMAITVLTYVFFTASHGLFWGLKKANLVWFNEAEPIKQNVSVLFSMLLNWAAILLAGALGGAASFIMPVPVAFLLIALVFALLAWAFRRWNGKQGAVIFNNL